MNKFYRLRSLIAVAGVLSILVAGIPFSTAAQDTDKAVEEGFIQFVRETAYSSYYDEHKDKNRPSSELTLDADSLTDSEGMTLLDAHEGQEKVLSFSSEGGWAEFTADIPEGVYHLELQYIAAKENHTDLEMEIMIDGAYPFDDAQVISLTRLWKDETEITQDEDGNDILPNQVESCAWRAEQVFNRQGFYDEPYIFYFSGGRHTIRVAFPQDNVLVSCLRLCNNLEAVSYEDYAKENEGAAPGSGTVQEAEDSSRKSHSTLYPTIDRTSALTSPADPVKLKYNTIGQSNFSSQGQWIEWEIDVKESGLYHLSFRARQNITRGIISRRKVTVDGETPFRELNNIEFPYSSGFYYKTLGDDTPYAIYLEKGTHTIHMEVTAPEVSPAMRAVNDAVFELNTMYRELMMIVGPNPDTFRDYYVEREIPDLLERMQSLSALLKEQQAYLDSLSGSRSASTGDIQQMAVMLDSMIEKPETIPYRMTAFQSNISSVSAWISSVSAQPLELDTLVLTPAGELPGKAEASFFTNLFFGIRAVIGSFFQDYSTLGGASRQDSINVWVGLGRDQAQVIKQMSDSYFTPSTGIKVNLSLVQGSVLEATLAGKGPDVSLFLGDGQPMNLAARGALVGLNQYQPLTEAAETFNDGAMTPYIFGDDYYGLPLTQSFPVMFYRKDVLSELGIEKLPQTWEEFYEIIPKLQRANLTVGLGDTNVSQYGANQAPNFGFVFPSLVLQRGGGFYKDDLSATRFDEEVVIQSFCDWTELYTQYSLQLEYDMFNRFRTGEMPIAFAAYTTYNQIAFGAPEIKGLWGISPVPGTMDEEGNIHREVAASGSSGAVIFKKAENPKACYEFIKWLTSDEMQILYGRTIEALMGPAARYDTANKHALRELPWSISEYTILSEQRATVQEVPVIPATYYVNREITNAFRRVVLKNQNPRETLILFNRSINKEIKRKNEELQRLQLD